MIDNESLWCGPAQDYTVENLSMSYRISGTIPDELDRDMEALFSKGYSPSDVVKEGARLFIQRKKSEGAIPA
jgi:Arc/MetJ-type ribon-helix-helix transcriptional regulator